MAMDSSFWNTIELSEELQVKAEKELNEKAQWRDRDIQALKDMIDASEGLHGCTEPAYLLRFLRARKFDYDRAFNLYVNHYRVRRENPDVFGDLRPETVMQVIQSGILGIMPLPDDCGQRIVVFRPGLWDPNFCTTTDILKANLICVESLLKDATVQIHGIVVIVDLTAFGFSHANQFGISFARRASSFLQDSTPVRVKAIHFVNEPYIFGYAFAVLKPFLKEKIQKRLMFHGSNTASLHKHIQPHLLPENGNLGGSGPTLPIAEYVVELLKETSYFENMCRYYADENVEGLPCGIENGNSSSGRCGGPGFYATTGSDSME